MGTPPVREHSQDGDTPPSMGTPLKMETPLEWGHHLPPVFPLSSTGAAGAASTQGGIRLGGWEGSGFGGDMQCPLCWGGALTLSTPTAAKSLLNKKADGVKVRGQREAGVGCFPPIPLSPFHLSPPAPDQQHQRQCRCHQSQRDPPSHCSGMCPPPCTPPRSPIPSDPSHEPIPFITMHWLFLGSLGKGRCPKDGKGCAGRGHGVIPLDRQGG